MDMTSIVRVDSPQRPVSPMPAATAALAASSSRVRASPVKSAAAMTPRIGWLRKKAASPEEGDEQCQRGAAEVDRDVAQAPILARGRRWRPPVA